MKLKKASALFKSLLASTLIIFVTALVFADLLKVEQSQASVMDLPAAGQLLKLSADYDGACLKGLKLDLDNPLNIDFMIDLGDDSDLAKADAQRLIRYFMAALTVPEEELWVNLSPYENDRIASDTLSDTDIGRDLLAQDYILKQLSSSLSDPDTDLGQSYWQQISSADVADTFNKIWVVPGDIEILENKNIAVISEASLDVMTEADYLAMKNNNESQDANSALKDLLVPKIREEVNNGENFSLLRQVYRSILMGMWFKEKFKESFYKDYINKAKLEGIDLEDDSMREKIYAQYVKAFEKGVYDKIIKVYDPLKKTKVKRRYFSGGVEISSALGQLKQNIVSSSLTEISDELSTSNILVASSTVTAEQDLEEKTKELSWKDFKKGYSAGDKVLFSDLRMLRRTDEVLGETITDWVKETVIDNIKASARDNGVALDDVSDGSDEFFMGIDSSFSGEEILNFIRDYSQRIVDSLRNIELQRYNITYDLLVDMRDKLAKLKADGEIKAFDVFQGPSTVIINVVQEKGKAFDLPATSYDAIMPHPSFPALMLEAREGESLETTISLVGDALSNHKDKKITVEGLYRDYSYKPLLTVEDLPREYQDEIARNREALSNKPSGEESVVALFDKYEGNNLDFQTEQRVNDFVSKRIKEFHKLTADSKRNTWARKLVLSFNAKHKRELFAEYDKFAMLPRYALGRVLQMIAEGEITETDVKEIYFRSAPNQIIKVSVKNGKYDLVAIDPMAHLGYGYKKRHNDVTETQLYKVFKKSLANRGRKADMDIVKLVEPGFISPTQKKINQGIFNFTYEHYGNKALNDAYSYEGADFIIKATLEALVSNTDEALALNLKDAAQQLDSIFVHDTTFVVSQISQDEALKHAEFLSTNHVDAAISSVEKLLEVRDYVLPESRYAQSLKIFDNTLHVQLGPIVKHFSDYKNKSWAAVENNYQLAKWYQRERGDDGELQAKGGKFLKNLHDDLGVSSALGPNEASPRAVSDQMLSAYGNVIVHVGQDHERIWSSFGTGVRAEARRDAEIEMWEGLKSENLDHKSAINRAIKRIREGIDGEYYNGEWFLHLMNKEGEITKEEYDALLQIHEERFLIKDFKTLNKQAVLIDNIVGIIEIESEINKQYLRKTIKDEADLKEALEMEQISADLTKMELESNLLSQYKAAATKAKTDADLVNEKLPKASRFLYKKVIELKKFIDMTEKMLEAEGKTLADLPVTDPRRSFTQGYSGMTKVLEMTKHKHELSSVKRTSDAVKEKLQAREIAKLDTLVEAFKMEVDELPAGWNEFIVLIENIIKEKHYHISFAMARAIRRIKESKSNNSGPEDTVYMSQAFLECMMAVGDNVSELEAAVHDLMMLSLGDDVVVDGPVILVSIGDILPAQLNSYMRRNNIVGFMGDVGAAGHLGTEARNRSIAGFFGMDVDFLKKVKPSDKLALLTAKDSKDNKAVINPEQEIVDQVKENILNYDGYIKNVNKYVDDLKRMGEDYTTVEYNNGSKMRSGLQIGQLKDLRIERKFGQPLEDAAYVWMRSERMDEATLTDVVNALNGRKLVFRTYDRQEDKDSPEFKHLGYSEENMGFAFYRTKDGRSLVVEQIVDILLEMQEHPTFKPDILFPDVSDKSDVDYINELIEQAKLDYAQSVYDEELAKREKVEGPYDNDDKRLLFKAILADAVDHMENVGIKIMIESPLAVNEVTDAFSQETMLTYTQSIFKDRFTGIHIGTSDLTASIAGVKDRTDPSALPKLHKAYLPMLKSIWRVAQSAATAGVSVSLCGEWAEQDLIGPFAAWLGNQMPDLNYSVAVPGRAFARRAFERHYLDYNMDKGRMDDILTTATNYIQYERWAKKLLAGAREAAASSSVKKKDVGGVDLAGMDIKSSVEQGSSAIELAAIDLGDFEGLSFRINGIDKLKGQKQILAFLSK